MNKTHKVVTDALQTLGTIIDENAGRDAIHLAVEPVIAAEKLYPGEEIGLVQGKASKKASKKLGIVDPFIKGFVPAGDRFWLIVFPRQITSLRHVWEHPDFPSEKSEVSKKEISEALLREFCMHNDCPSYEEVVGAAVSHINNGGYSEEYLHFNGSDAHGAIPPEFWHHIEVITGLKCENPPEYFSCSC